MQTQIGRGRHDAMRSVCAKNNCTNGGAIYSAKQILSARQRTRLAGHNHPKIKFEKTIFSKVILQNSGN